MHDGILGRSQNIPTSARDLPRLLVDTATVSDSRSHELSAQRTRARELEIQFYQLTWLLDHNDDSFVDSITRTHKQELDRIAETIKESQRIESKSAELAGQITLLLARLREHDVSAIKSVVALDMSRYSDIVKDIQDRDPGNGPRIIKELKRRIQGWVDDGLRAIGVDTRRTPRERTGDGAIVILDSPDQAVRFGEQFHKVAHAYTKEKRRSNDQMHFRCGIGTGPLIVDQSDTNSFEFAGLIVSNAVRLEAGCQTGCILVDPATYELLSASERAQFGDEVTVFGKRKEKFRARQRRVVSAARWEKPALKTAD